MFTQSDWMSCHFGSSLMLSHCSATFPMMEVSATCIIVCHQPDGFRVVWMSMCEELGIAALEMHAFMPSAVTDFLCFPGDTKVGLWM